MQNIAPTDSFARRFLSRMTVNLIQMNSLRQNSLLGHFLIDLLIEV